MTHEKPENLEIDGVVISATVDDDNALCLDFYGYGDVLCFRVGVEEALKLKKFVEKYTLWAFEHKLKDTAVC